MLQIFKKQNLLGYRRSSTPPSQILLLFHFFSILFSFVFKLFWRRQILEKLKIAFHGPYHVLRVYIYICKPNSTISCPNTRQDARRQSIAESLAGANFSLEN